MTEETCLNVALYFEARAKSALNERERARFLAGVRKYRALALENPKTPAGVSGLDAVRGKGQLGDSSLRQ
jgi:hypothetical protein